MHVGQHRAAEGRLYLRQYRQPRIDPDAPPPRHGRPVRLVEGGFEDERHPGRSEEHTSELQSLMRISYAVFCLQKKTTYITTSYQSDQGHRRDTSHHTTCVPHSD